MSRLLKQINLFEEIFNALQAAFPEDKLVIHALPLDDTIITLPPTAVLPAARILVEQFDFYHLSTITGEDTGSDIVLLYHFWSQYGITLRTTLSYDHLSIATLTNLIPGATFYEREVCEMLGVTFEGHDVRGPLFMPDDWEGEHPLRK